MATIAIVGAGLALISRDRRRMDHLVLGLGAEDLTARGPAANGDPASLTSALDRASRALGPIEALPYSPLPLKESLRPVLGDHDDRSGRRPEPSV